MQASASSSSASTSSASSPCRWPSGWRRERHRHRDRTPSLPVPASRAGKCRGTAMAARRALARRARSPLLRDLRLGELAGLAAHRRAIGRLRLEHSIPFLDWTITPYWSINAFYGLSPFVCASKAELDTHARRLLTAQIVAVICFILLPLRFEFLQPETHGVAGFLFAALTSFDKPFNQAPSLHIALLVILWVLYARHVPRWALWLLHPWFLLVGISVLTTYQHHFIDIPTGALLGFLCLWLWPDRGPTPLTAVHFTKDRRRLLLAARYGAGSAIIAVVAFVLGNAALWLLWPAISLILVAANYGCFGADGFQKGPDGHMTLAARVLLAPYLIGVFLNSRAWTRRAPKAVVVADRMAAGRWHGRTAL